MQPQVQQVLIKLEHLSTDRLAEVEDFIDFLQHKDQDKHLRHDFTNASVNSFKEAWDNPEDDDYDKL